MWHALLWTCLQLAQSSSAGEYPAQIAAAERALRAGQREQAQQQLQATAAEQRGFEYRWLEALTRGAGEPNASLDPLRLTTAAPCELLAFAPDGQRLASAHRDGSIELWDTATWERLARWSTNPEQASVAALAWSNDSRRLHSGARDGTLVVWDAWTLAALQRTKLSSTLQHIQCTLRGDLWVLAGSDRRVTLVETQGWRARWTSEPLPAAIEAICVSPEGGRLALCCADRSTHMWGLRDGHELWMSTRSSGSALLYGLDGQRMWVAGTDLRELRLADGADLSRMDYGVGPVAQLSYSPLAARLALAASTLVLVDPRTARVTWRAGDTLGNCHALAWNPAREELVVASSTPALSVYIPRPLAEQRQERDQAQELRQQARAWWKQQRAEGAHATDLLHSLEREPQLSAGIRQARLAILTTALNTN